MILHLLYMFLQFYLSIKQMLFINILILNIKMVSILVNKALVVNKIQLQILSKLLLFSLQSLSFFFPLLWFVCCANSFKQKIIDIKKILNWVLIGFNIEYFGKRINFVAWDSLPFCIFHFLKRELSILAERYFYCITGVCVLP